MRIMTTMLAVCTLLLGVGPASAQPFYEGKEFRIVVGFAPGGGNDLFARVFPQYLGSYIEGNPTVIVENRPGAGGVSALNWYADAAPRDGTVAMVVSGNLINRMILGADGVTAEIADLIPIISGPLGRVNYVNTSIGYEKPQDLLALDEPLFLGVTDPLSTIGSVVGLSMLEVPFRAVKGYPGKGDAMLAVERGETTIADIATPIYNDQITPLVEAGTMEPLFAQGMLDGDELVRDPANPNLPTIAEFYRELHGTDPSGPSWEAYKAVLRAIGNGGKILMVHRDTPPEAIDAIKAGMTELLKDEAFQTNARAALEGYGFTFGPNLDEDIAAIIAMPPEAKTWMQELFARDYGMTFEQ